MEHRRLIADSIMYLYFVKCKNGINQTIFFNFTHCIQICSWVTLIFILLIPLLHN